MTEQTVAAAPSRPSGRAGLALLLILGLFAAVYLLAARRYQAPPPRGEEAPAGEFSAQRALAVLRRLAGDQAPHPVASEANARVRRTAVAELSRLGLTPSVEEDLECSAAGLCSRVWNVVARVPGTGAGKSVLLMAHYDSVAAGPGIADDLAGVAAVLEIARAVRSGPPLPRGLIVLLTDGEEAMLLGAEAFAARSPAMREVGAVVNLEARGASGPSLLFETSGRDGWMIERYAQRARRPVTSSLFAAVYDALPNDTDLSVFKRRDVPGLNFAFVGDPLLYHTSADRVENLSLASLQHQGDGGLAAVQALAVPELDRPPAGERTFFDLLAWRVVHWPRGWNLPLAVVAAILLAAATALARRGGGLGWGGTALGSLLPLGAALVSGAAAFGLQALLSAVIPTPWLAEPAPAKVAFFALALAVTLGLAAPVARRSGGWSLWAGIWLGWAVLGLLFAWSLPAAAYLFVVPAGAAGLAGILACAARGRGLGALTAVAVVPGLAAAALWLPAVGILYDGLGLSGLLLTSVVLTLLLGAVLPLAAAAPPRLSGGLALAALVAVVAGFLWSYIGHSYSAEAPRPFPIAFHQDADSGAARWLLFARPPIPEPVRSAGGIGLTPERPYPWSHPQSRVFAGPAPVLSAPLPELAVLADSAEQGKRRLRLLLTSPRGAREGVVVIPAAAGVESLAVGGREVPQPTGAAGPWRMVTFLGIGPEGIEIEAVLGESEKLDWHVADRTLSLPPSGAALLAARPRWAVPAHLGDTAMVSRKVKI